jgi:actin-like ATPase involved in cell morphogenesis
MPVYVAEEPLNSVALGTGIFIENTNAFRDVLVNPERRKSI